MFWDYFPLIMAHNKHIHFFLFEPVLVQHWMEHIPRCQFSLGGFVLLSTLQHPYHLQNIILLWPMLEIALLLAWQFFVWLSYQKLLYIYRRILQTLQHTCWFFHFCSLLINFCHSCILFSSSASSSFSTLYFKYLNSTNRKNK